MARWCKLAFAVTAISLGMTAQPFPRNWSDRAEYNLGTRALREGDPNRQIALLHQWESEYPRSDFNRERLILFVEDLAHVRQLDECFARALELLRLDRNDPVALVLIVALGPRLPSPSASQITAVVDSASKLQSMQIARSTTTAEPLRVSPPAEPDSLLLAFIRELRRDHDRTNLDPGILKSRVIESALAWAKDLKK